MSRAIDDREGLSPEPVNLIDVFEDDDESDDIYQPAAEGTELITSTDDDGEEEDDEDVDFADAQEDLGDIEIVFEEAGDDDDEDDGEEAEGEEEGEATETEQPTGTATRPVAMTLQQLNHLLAGNGPIRRLLMQRLRGGAGAALRSDDESDSDQEYMYRGYRRRPARPKFEGDRFPKVPSDAGRGLMSSGLYGARDSHVDIRRKRKRTFSERLMWRQLGLDPRPSMRRQSQMISQNFIPSTSTADKIIHYDSRAYSGQYSDDGQFFFSCTQNFKVRMYDTSNPYEWTYYKTVDYPYGQWTITDASLSPDNRWLAYSSIRHIVCLAATDPNDHSDYTLLDFANFAPGLESPSRNGGGRGGGWHRNGFGIWSLRFSGDGREIVAGTSDHSVVVHDLETRQSTVRLSNHEDDVNAVCFGDKMSPHILYSGSDDQTLRVWDRRSMADGREAGLFVGHTEGLTYVDSKGDGRYVLSNGKDQMMKLWDLRKMISPGDFREKVDLGRYTTNFDYRFNIYETEEYVPNPHDCSVVTFRGHSVLKTLIRCHFSPVTGSNSRYVYSGSEDGKVWIWEMDGRVKGTVDVDAATRGTRIRHGGGEEGGGGWLGEVGGLGGGRRGQGDEWKTCVRDASWCPTGGVLAATSWNGWGMSTGTVSLHSWNDGAESDEGTPAMSTNYNSRLDPKEDFDRAAARYRGENGAAAAGGRASARLRSRGVRRTRGGDEDW